MIAPPIPKTPEETGIERESLLKLLGKTLYVHGTMTPSAIARETRLPHAVIALLIKELMRLQLIEAKGLAGEDMKSELRYALGGHGQSWALEAMAQSQYVGPAPVTLESFQKQITAQSIAREHIHRADLIRGMSHLILPSDLIDHLGPAVNSAKSILLYGEPGNGKTSIAEAVGKIFQETIYLPYCIEVGGQIINFFDATVHAPATADGEPTANGAGAYDARWIACRRPVIITGGELTLHMLDLMFNPVSKFYEAPIHLRAAGGVFIIDDFGRQQTNPQTILNRWIIPLERGYDYLTLHTGRKFAIPFDQLVIFSTNIEPTQLADAAGLRRLYYKIFVPSPTPPDYRKIFEIECARGGLPFNEQDFEAFFRKYYSGPGNAPAGHHPKYIVDFIASVCDYKGTEPAMEDTLLDAAWRNLHVI